MRSLWALVVLIPWLNACVVAIPIPAGQDPDASRLAVAESGVRILLSPGDAASEVRERLGEPVVNLGPERVYVYKWAVSWGRLVWFVGGPSAAAAGVEPLVEGHLFMVALDESKTVVDAATKPFKPFSTITAQVGGWLSEAGRVEHMAELQADAPGRERSRLFVYRPASAPCGFPRFDSNAFKPSIALDNVVAGDLHKGEYLGLEAIAGEHVVTVDPLPHYRFEGQEDSRFVKRLAEMRRPVSLSLTIDDGADAYLEVYLCTGTGSVDVHAELRDHESALGAIEALRPAWAPR